MKKAKLRNHFSQLKKRGQNMSKAMVFQSSQSSIRIAQCQSFLKILKMIFKIYRILKFRGLNQNILSKNHFSKLVWTSTTTSKILYQILKKIKHKRASLIFQSVEHQELVKLPLLIYLLVNLIKMNILKHLDHQTNKKRYSLELLTLLQKIKR